MRRWTPSIAPNRDDQNIYLVEDCFDRQGCVWREADAERTDLETVISDLMSGQYNNPLRVIAFNTAEHWSEDVSADVALESSAAPTCPIGKFHAQGTPDQIDWPDVLGRCL